VCLHTEDRRFGGLGVDQIAWAKKTLAEHTEVRWTLLSFFRTGSAPGGRAPPLYEFGLGDYSPLPQISLFSCPNGKLGGSDTVTILAVLNTLKRRAVLVSRAL
jgi:hypothetical protein